MVLGYSDNIVFRFVLKAASHLNFGGAAFSLEIFML